MLPEEFRKVWKSVDIAGKTTGQIQDEIYRKVEFQRQLSRTAEKPTKQNRKRSQKREQYQQQTAANCRKEKVHKNQFYLLEDESETMTVNTMQQPPNGDWFDSDEEWTVDVDPYYMDDQGRECD